MFDNVLNTSSNIHCVNSVRLRSYSLPYYPAFGLNTDQKNPEYGHLSRSDSFETKNSSANIKKERIYK